MNRRTFAVLWSEREGEVATTQYEEALRQVQALSPCDQKRLLAEIEQHLESGATAGVSLLELKGLGKAVWQDINVQEHIRQERDSWNG